MIIIKYVMIFNNSLYCEKEQESHLYKDSVRNWVEARF